MNIPKKMLQKFLDIKGEIHSNPLVSRAPGRVEVLGNHTDYNGGFILASTINRFVWVVGVKAENTLIHSINFTETSKFDHNQVGPVSHENWDKYIKGIFWALREHGFKTQGATSVIYGNVQMDAGLSSSAALEVAFANLIVELNDINVDMKTRALLAFEAERNYCRIACGIMDQFTSQLGKANSLLNINCTTLNIKHVPLKANLKLLVVDSMVTRSASEALNLRRKECQETTTVLQEAGWNIKNLSEISETQLDEASEQLTEVQSRRLSHIVHENTRVRDAVALLQKDDFSEFGQLMFESHVSSRDLYEVSHPCLDLLVEIAGEQDGVIGSRMTGAGFGGAVICLIKAKLADRITNTISSEYEKETGKKPNTIVCEIPDGVKTQEINLDGIRL